MSWLSVAALVWCGVAFFLAAERAYALRKGGAIGRALLAVAAVSYVAVLVVLVQYGLGAGFEKFLAASVAAVSGLACFWFVKIHVDHKRPAAALIATGLGLAMFGVSFLTMVGNLEGRAPRVVDQLPDDPNARLDERKRQLDERLLGGIPEFRSKLRRQAGEVKRQIERASDSAK
ncbi:MAG: hypothetical protein MI741_16385, partial [Rhodospirillales bacterium]|nr:hypothetical protein [Rhodospirillales bacterium]